MIKSTKLEKIILQYGLTLGCIYQLYQIINGLVSSAPTVGINIAVGVFFFLVWWVCLKLNNITWLALAIHILMLPVLAYFWKDFGGLAGTVPLTLYIYVSMIAGTLHGALLISVFIIYAISFIFLTFFPELTALPLYDTANVERIQIGIDFFAIALIMTSFLIFLKEQLVTFRERITHRHQQLQYLATTLEEQTEKLRVRQEETLSINENLESIVEERIRGIEEKNKQLEEYAFINAHLLRAPLCRILGIIDLMEKEELSHDLSSVKEKARDIDLIIRKVNETM